MLSTNVDSCAMRGHCGGSSIFSPQLPCPYDGPPKEPTQRERDLLVSVCGASFADSLVCCDNDQVETLRDRLAMAEPILSSCPACRNNFRHFFCSFTCSPNQGSFLNVTSTQETSTGKRGVQSIDFRVSEQFGSGFYDSCKSVQFGASNAFAMDYIGGGAKNYHEFFAFLGKKSDLGSPFQINFPTETSEPTFDATPRNCADSSDLMSRCPCTDCPSVCPTLPYVPPPGSGPTCHVGVLSCLSFILILAYSIAVVGFLSGIFLQRVLSKRRETAFSEVGMSSAESTLDTPLSPRRGNHALVGASSLAGHEAEESAGVSADGRGLGRGAALLDPIETTQPRQYPLNAFLRRFFYRLGLAAANYPWLTFAGVFAIVGLLNLGWKRFEIETDPVRLWVAPDSEAKLQKEYFDEHFGPFYRTEQIFVTSVDDSRPVLSWDSLKWWMDVESDIRSLKSPSGLQLEDVCFEPMGPGTGCVVQSVGGWFGNSLEEYDEDTWARHLLDCANSPVDCRPDFGQPLAPQFVLGGVPKTNDKERYLDARALVVTYVVSNSLNQSKVDRAEDWERTLRAYLEDVSQKAPRTGFKISFSTGVSLEEELNKSTNMDVRIVVLSYIAMFFYVALTLGSGGGNRDEESAFSSLRRWVVNFPKLFRRSSPTESRLAEDPDSSPTFLPPLPRGLFVYSKFTLGLFGILLVILSVSSSVGLFSALGVRVTLIIAEVIPFLVLAVGVDNIFILVHELDRQNLLHGPNADPAAIGPHIVPNGISALSPSTARATYDGSADESIEAQSLPTYFPAEERVARSLARMGPSIMLSTITETAAFGLGALVPMPAVRNFALYAAGSVLLNAVLQCTVFISALTLDLRRVETSRMDCLPCIRLPGRIALADAPPSRSSLGRIARFIRRYYAPTLLSPAVKQGVVAFFGGIFILSVISIQHIQLGLDRRLALPSESYLVTYFSHLDEYFEVGPPVYFVTKGGNFTARSTQQELCGKFTTCDDLSLANILEGERKRTESSYIAEPAAVWVDNFMNWLNPLNEACCRVRRRDPGTFCTPTDRDRLCMPCMSNSEPAWNITMEGFPEGPEFMRYVKQWLVSPTTEDCPLGGAATFGDAISLTADKTAVEAAHVRTYNAPLKSEADFINALDASRRIAADISSRTGLSVFPYSIFHVFFDQYAHIIGITQELIGLGLASVLIITALFLGSWRTGTIVTGVVALTVTSCIGVMGIWDISLNAISVVNLVISLGIAVEFCAHIARAFMSAGSGLPLDHPAGQKERDDRMFTALVDVGPSVLSGITFTKLIGMAVLGLTRSRLLEIYYFRMWLTLIVSGALHGLVLLPVVLSLAGGPGFPYQEADEEWMANAVRDDYEYAPFLAEEDLDSD